jgi:hypothetical protein
VEVESDEQGLPPIRIPIEEAVTRTITKTKENVKVRRAYGISVEKDIFPFPSPICVNLLTI